MYFQLFITNRETQKKSQFSCDTFEEVQQVVEKKQPKFVFIEYYDCSGLVGIAYKYFDFLKGQYITYKKIAK
jgi:hypothetical protein